MSIKKSIPKDVFTKLVDKLFEQICLAKDEDSLVILCSAILNKPVSASEIKFDPKGVAIACKDKVKQASQEEIDRIFVAIQEKELIEARKVDRGDAEEELDRMANRVASRINGDDMLSQVMFDFSEESKVIKKQMIALLSCNSREEVRVVLEESIAITKEAILNKIKEDSNE